jgi:hypothetical protein
VQTPCSVRDVAGAVPGQHRQMGKCPMKGRQAGMDALWCRIMLLVNVINRAET